MIEVMTQRIWTLTPEKDIAARYDSEVLVDSDEEAQIIDLGDVKRALFVSGGLKPDDFFVFFRFAGVTIYDEETDVLGFVVGAVEKDGSGVLVHDAKVEDNLRDWSTPYIEAKWDEIDRIHPDIFTLFSMERLAHHVRQRRSTRDNVAA